MKEIKKKWRKYALEIYNKSDDTLKKKMTESDSVPLVQIGYAEALERGYPCSSEAEEIYTSRQEDDGFPALSEAELNALRGVLREMRYPPTPKGTKSTVYNIVVISTSCLFFFISCDMFNNTVSHGLQTESNPLVGPGLFSMAVGALILFVCFKYKAEFLSGEFFKRKLGVMGVNVDALPDPEREQTGQVK